jgi:hypothetical protein
MDFPTRVAEIKRMVVANPGNEEKRRRLMELRLAWFRQALGAWPDGLLFDREPATLEECRRLKSEATDARREDAAGEYRDFLEDFEVKTDILIGQLKSDEGRCFF